MGQAGNSAALMSAVTLAAASAYVSLPMSLAGADFVSLTVMIDIGSFTNIAITADVLVPSGSWRGLYDPAAIAWRIVLSANFSGMLPLGAQYAVTATRTSQLALSGCHAIRFTVTPSGSNTTPGSSTLSATAFRRPAGAYQNR